MFQRKPSHSRLPLHDPAWSQRRKPFLQGILGPFLILHIIFLAAVSYLFGAAYNQSSRIRNLNVLAVDYDGGGIGQGIAAAYQSLAAPGFPTLIFQPIADFPTPVSIRDAVCKGDYWGAVYVHSGASNRLLTAVRGIRVTNETSLKRRGKRTVYNPADTVSYTYNQARYSAIADSALKANLQALVGAARPAFYQTNDGRIAFAVLSAALASNDTDLTPALQAYLNPIQATAVVIQPTTQGARVLLNSAGMIMPVLMQFFYQMALNGLLSRTRVLSGTRISHVIVLRSVVSKTYTFTSGLITTGYFWAFREGWNVDGRQFGLTWMALWLYAEVHWLVIDTLLGTVIPMALFANFMVTWSLVNVASALFPFEVAPGWYKVGFALPARETWSVLVGIWSGCGAGQLRVALPVLFAWWVVGSFGSVWAMRRRCVMAEKEEAHERGFLPGGSNEDLEGATTELAERGKDAEGFRETEMGQGRRPSATSVYSR